MRAFSFLLLIGCGDKDTQDTAAEVIPDTDGETTPVDSADPDDTGVSSDADGDGFAATEDCDDTDATVNPGAAEVCDGVDNDCDGLTDADDDSLSDGTVRYTDSDGDGFGDPDSSAVACGEPSGTAATGDDCDDADASVYPGAAEVCGDGVSNDCDATAADAFSTCADFDLSAATRYGGETFNDQAGRRVRRAGDVNGDGVTDLLIGAPQYDLSTGSGDPGRAYLVYGGATGSFSLGDAALEMTGESNYDSAGFAVAGAGDQDGDGLDDLLVGAYAHNNGTASDGGSVYLVYGGVTGQLPLATADVMLTGSERSAAAGYALAGGEDATGDGSPDFLVGAYYAGYGAGAAYVFSSPLTGTLDLARSADYTLSGSGTSYAGSSLAFAGDTNGDGIEDIIVGAYIDSTTSVYAGAAYLVHGGGLSDMSLADADGIFTGEGSSNYAGFSVDGAGDVDGDGLDDVIIGATAAAGYAGAAYVVLGGTSGTSSLGSAALKAIGEQVSDGAGISVSDAGDVDGDGLADVAIGSTAHAGSAGVVYIVPGGSSGSITLGSTGYRIDGLTAGSYVGGSIDSLGDVDGNGLDDLLIGAFGATGGTALSGAVYVVRTGGY